MRALRKQTGTPKTERVSEKLWGKTQTAEPCQWQGCSGGNTERDKFSRTGMVANKENKQQQQLLVAQVTD